MDFIKKEPALVGALATLCTVVLGFFIHNPQLVAAMVGVFVAFLGVRQVVVPVTTAATQITQSATQAATQVVQNLDQTTVGTVGEVTDAATSVINNTVDQVVGGLNLKGK